MKKTVPATLPRPIKNACDIQASLFFSVDGNNRVLRKTSSDYSEDGHGARPTPANGETGRLNVDDDDG